MKKKKPKNNNKKIPKREMNKSSELSILLLKTFNSSFLILDGLDYLKSNRIVEIVRKVNIIATLIVIIIGFIGHSLIIFVFGQKRYLYYLFSSFLLILI